MQTAQISLEIVNERIVFNEVFWIAGLRSDLTRSN